MRVLVTGAAGLIGSGVAERLGSEHDVIGLDLIPGPQVQIVADCHDVAEWRQLAGPVDAIVHTAALHAPHVGQRGQVEFRRTNVEATSRLLDFALGVAASHFVLTSTTSIYGHVFERNDTAVWVDEELQPQPRDIYDETKLRAEELVVTAGGSMTVTSLRISRCFPEPAEAMAWYRLYRGIDRRDVAEAHALALARKGLPATYNVSASTPFKREDCDGLHCEAPSVIERRCPGLIEALAARGWSVPGSIDRVYDNGRIANELGFSPRFGMDAVLSDDWDPIPAR